jgi:uncharacterized protein (TIGR02246 family)
MKKTIISLTIFCLLLTAQFAFAQTSKDSSELQKLAESTIIYFYKGDMYSFGNLFGSDATFITVNGVVAKGKNQIVDMHKNCKIDSANVVKYKQPKIKFVTKDIADL